MDDKSLCADDLDMINKHSDMVYRMAYFLLKDKYDEEDIHQEVFIKYLKKKPCFVDEGHEKAWFLRVTINMCKNLWKTVWKQRVVGMDDEDIMTYESHQESQDDIVGIVKKLPKKYRVVIHLFYYEELSVEEIAKILGSKNSTVRTQLTRARAKLKDLLEEEEDV